MLSSEIGSVLQYVHVSNKYHGVESLKVGRGNDRADSVAVN